MKLMGIDSFAPTGSAPYLLEHFGLTADAIAAAAQELLKNGR
jgi:transketolase